MGLKMSFAVLLTTEPGMAFKAKSVHDPDAAERIASPLLPNSGPVGTSTLGEAMYSDRLMIGIHQTSTMIGDPRLFKAEHMYELPATVFERQDLGSSTNLHDGATRR